MSAVAECAGWKRKRAELVAGFDAVLWLFGKMPAADCGLGGGTVEAVAGAEGAW